MGDPLTHALDANSDSLATEIRVEDPKTMVLELSNGLLHAKNLTADKIMSRVERYFDERKKPVFGRVDSDELHGVPTLKLRAKDPFVANEVVDALRATEVLTLKDSAAVTKFLTNALSQVAAVARAR